MNTRPLWILAAALGSLTLPALTGEAKAATCTAAFNDSTSLYNINLYGNGFIPNGEDPDVYEQPCGSDRLRVEDIYYNHYHFGYKSACVGANGCRLLPLSNIYEVDLTCHAGRTGAAQCSAIAPWLWSRYLTGHTSLANFRVNLLPTGGTYCVVNGSGGTTCTSQVGQLVAPYKVKMGAGSIAARLWRMYFQLIAVGTPAGTRYTFAKYRTVVQDNMTAGNTYTFPSTASKSDQYQITAVNPSAGGNFRIDEWGVQY